MAEVNIPAGPLNEAPWGAIRYDRPEPVADARRAAVRAALDGVELGAYDERMVAWLAEWDVPTVATFCSWLHRARAAATAGRIVVEGEQAPIVLPPGAAVDYINGDDGYHWLTCGTCEVPLMEVTAGTNVGELATTIAAHKCAQAAQGGDA